MSEINLPLDVKSLEIILQSLGKKEKSLFSKY